MIKIALAGNPNCGKTMLFNALTDSNQYVGNWAGVTVEAKEGRLKDEKDVIVADLPGIYSLSPYTPEEVVARNYLVNEEPDVILNIIDGTNLERNLYLTTQLCEIGIPVVMAINMIDLVKKNGDIINLEEISEHFGCVCFEISALKGTGVKKCAKKAVELARTNKGIPPIHHSFDDRVESAIHFISAMLPDGTDMLHKRYYATKIFERDRLVSDNFPDCESIIKDVEKYYDDDSESIIADQRYKYITSCIDECRTKSGKTPISEKIDAVVTNKYLSLPIFVLIMFGVYYLSVTTLGSYLSDLITQKLFGAEGLALLADNFLTSINCAPWLTSLITDGIIGGVGAVLSFVPQIIVLFIFLSFLEDCGYMSRIAFIMDRLFRKFGLSGKSFIPILVGTGCGVPGIMSSRTIENVNERRMTIITTTFIPCGAKLPVISLIASSLFGGAWWVAPSAYFTGIASIIISGIILKKTRIFSGDVSPFVMELPSYHMPTLKSVFRATWDRSWSYVKKAGTIIFLASCAVWFLSNFGFYDGKFGMVQYMDNSVLAYIGNFVHIIFSPLGFGTWQASVATLLGLVAKEEIVGVFGVLYGNISEGFNALSGYSFLVFNLLCAPCVAAMGAIRREMNSPKWTLFAIGYQCFFAYCVSLCIYQLGLLFVSGDFAISTIFAFLIIAALIFMLIRKPYNNRKITKR
ncbi:MAG: ferrous iron transport protein B [Eubacterium sp.]|nr:ferrous iron transport protein B [Eubacterium sp.]